MRSRRAVTARLLATTVVALAGCGADADQGPAPSTYRFGPFTVAPGEEIATDCVSVTLHNPQTLYVNAVELATQAGFHHSNWFWVPEGQFPGPDGRWRCDDRGYDEAIAGGAGGVLFAQSTQSLAEGQRFGPGVVIAIPPRAKIVAGIHLLNGGDAALTTSLDLTLTPVPLAEVTTILSAMAIDYQALALPAQRRSTFTVECDLAGVHERVLGTPLDLRLHYVLPHYHELGRGIELIATGGPDGDRTILATQRAIGEPMGTRLDPPFDLTGYRGLRFTCRFDNPRDQVVGYGIGDQEMCVVQLFSDSDYLFAGGARDHDVGEPTDDGEVVRFSHPCQLFAFPAARP